MCVGINTVYCTVSTSILKVATKFCNEIANKRKAIRNGERSDKNFFCCAFLSEFSNTHNYLK